MRIFRWGYLVPRIALLAVALLVSELGLGYVAHWSLEQTGSSAIGARVDVAEGKASLLNARLELTGIQVTDPRATWSNLLEADSLELKLDPAAALRKKLVVEHGVLRGVRLGGERDSDGALPDADASVAIGGLAPQLSNAASGVAQQWLSDLRQRLSADATAGLKTPPLLERLEREWPDRAQELRGSAAELQAMVATLEADVREAKNNPLRGLETLQQAPARLAQLRSEAAQLRAAVAGLPAQAAADRRRIAEARQHDERLLRERVSVDSLDAESLGAALLGDSFGEPLGQLVGLLLRLREATSDEPIAESQPARGVDVLFPGTRQTPALLVKRLEILGSGRISGRPFELAGHLTGLTSDPKLHTEPMRLAFTTTGGLPLEVQATLDRSGETPHDVLVVTSEALPIPALRLGDTGGMRFATDPTTAALRCETTLTGDALSGHISITPKTLQVRHAVELAGDARLGSTLAASVARSLSEAADLETRVILGGEVSAPTYTIESRAGAVIAAALRDAGTASVTARAEQLLSKHQEALAAKLPKIEASMTGVVEQLNAEVATQLQGLDRLAELTKPGGIGRGLMNLGSRALTPPR